ncbi:MAG: CHRD domain-containing protein [Phycisphaerales bacterium]|nr:CHRD domain-containing protein [Phycisphaerales bacterium]
MKESDRVLLSIRFVAAAALVGCVTVGAPGDVIVYTATLSGANESPPVMSSGSGTSTVTIDTDLHTMRVEASFQDLTGMTTASHIHGPTAVPFEGNAGVISPTPSFPGFPLGVTSGSYDMTFDLTMASSYNPSFITAQGGMVSAAEGALLQSLAEGRSYLNIHSSAFGGGEIRGFYVVPAPGTGALCVTGGLVMTRRRR